MRNQIPLLTGVLGGIVLLALFFHAVVPIETSVLGTELALAAAAGAWIGWEVNRTLRQPA
jgi:hypothetical protein